MIWILLALVGVAALVMIAVVLLMIETSIAELSAMARRRVLRDEVEWFAKRTQR